MYDKFRRQLSRAGGTHRRDAGRSRRALAAAAPCSLPTKHKQISDAANTPLMHVEIRDCFIIDDDPKQGKSLILFGESWPVSISLSKSYEQTLVTKFVCHHPRLCSGFTTLVVQDRLLNVPFEAWKRSAINATSSHNHYEYLKSVQNDSIYVIRKLLEREGNYKKVGLTSYA